MKIQSQLIHENNFPFVKLRELIKNDIVAWKVDPGSDLDRDSYWLIGEIQESYPGTGNVIPIVVFTPNIKTENDIFQFASYEVYADIPVEMYLVFRPQ